MQYLDSSVFHSSEGKLALLLDTGERAHTHSHTVYVASIKIYSIITMNSRDNGFVNKRKKLNVMNKTSFSVCRQSTAFTGHGFESDVSQKFLT